MEAVEARPHAHRRHVPTLVQVMWQSKRPHRGKIVATTKNKTGELKRGIFYPDLGCPPLPDEGRPWTLLADTTRVCPQDSEIPRIAATSQVIRRRGTCSARWVGGKGQQNNTERALLLYMYLYCCVNSSTECQKAQCLLHWCRVKSSSYAYS